MNRLARIAILLVVACVASMSFAGVAGAKKHTQRINMIASEITVNLTKKKKKGKTKKYISLVNLQYICAEGFGQVKSSKSAGIGKVALDKKNKFSITIKKAKINNLYGEGDWGKGDVVIKGKVGAKNKLTGKLTVKNNSCGIKNVNLDAGN